MMRSVFRCVACSGLVLAVAVVLLSGAPRWVLANDPPQCPGKYKGNQYLGCENPGKVCYLPTKQSQCADAQSGNACDCPYQTAGGGDS